MVLLTFALSVFSQRRAAEGMGGESKEGSWKDHSAGAYL